MWTRENAVGESARCQPESKFLDQIALKLNKVFPFVDFLRSYVGRKLWLDYVVFHWKSLYKSNTHLNCPTISRRCWICGASQGETINTTFTFCSGILKYRQQPCNVWNLAQTISLVTRKTNALWCDLLHKRLHRFLKEINQLKQPWSCFKKLFYSGRFTKNKHVIKQKFSKQAWRESWDYTWVGHFTDRWSAFLPLTEHHLKRRRSLAKFSPNIGRWKWIQLS